MYDFSSPFFSAFITTGDGYRVPLWMSDGRYQGPGATPGSGPLGPPPASLANLPVGIPYVQSAEIKMGLAASIPELSVTLVPPFAEGIRLIDSPLFNVTECILEVTIGYATGTAPASVTASGILQPLEVSGGPDMQITLRAIGVAGLSTPRQCSPRVLSGTRQSIARVIARGPNAQRALDLDLSLVSALGPSAEEYQLLFVENKSFAQGWNTDWAALQVLAAEVRCWILESTVNGVSTLRFIPVRATAGRAPTKTYAYFDFQAPLVAGMVGTGGEIGPKVGVFPIQSFSTETLSAGFLPAGIRAIAISSLPSDKQPFPGVKLAQAAGQKLAGVITTTTEKEAASAESRVESGQNPPLVPLLADMKSLVLAAFDQASAALQAPEEKKVSSAMRGAVTAVPIPPEASAFDAFTPYNDDNGARIVRLFAASLVAAAVRMRAAAIQQISKLVIVKSDSGAEPANPVYLGDGITQPDPSATYPGIDENNGEGGDFLPGGDPEILDKAKSIYEQGTFKWGKDLTVNIGVGVPDAFPGEVAQVVGLGNKLGGNYVSYEVTHRIGTGGYDTSVLLKTNVEQFVTGVNEVTAKSVNKNKQTASAGDTAQPTPTP